MLWIQALQACIGRLISSRLMMVPTAIRDSNEQTLSPNVFGKNLDRVLCGSIAHTVRLWTRFRLSLRVKYKQNCITNTLLKLTTCSVKQMINKVIRLMLQTNRITLGKYPLSLFIHIEERGIFLNTQLSIKHLVRGFGFWRNNDFLPKGE